MASPGMTPPRRRRSMTGPVILILLGVLFLLGNMHLVSWGRLGVLFAHYWPLLLILWGVLKLIEHQRAKQEGTTPPGIGAGGVVLLVFLVIFGLAATHASRYHWDELGQEIGIDEGDLPIFGNAYEFDEQLTKELPAGATVKIINDRGAVNVSISNKDEIEITAHKKIRADQQEEADKWNDQTKTLVNVSGNLVTVNANTRGAGDHPVSVDLNIAIPRKAAVTIASQRGDVHVMGRDGNVDISSQRGDVSVDDINGDVSLNLDHGSMNMGHSSARVTQVSGEVSVQGRTDEVTISDVKGNVRLNGDFSDSLRLSKIGKSISFKSTRTDMEIVKLGGDLDLDSDSLRADNLTGPVRVSTRAKDISLQGITGDARVQNENGDVRLSLKSPGNVQIDNRNGDVTVGVPEKMGFKLDARSHGGEVQSDFSEISPNNDENDGKAAGTVGNGAVRLVLNTEHGNINLRKGQIESAHAADHDMPEPPEPPKPPKTPKAPRVPSPSVPTEN
jgi:DUF4097 and DUF4098 domain-containing protein YvlB